MTPLVDQTLHQFANLLPNWTLIPILTLLPNFGGFHRTLQRVRLANRGRLLLRTPGPVPFGTCICSNVETILSCTCHVYGHFESRTSLGTSILLQTYFKRWFKKEGVGVNALNDWKDEFLRIVDIRIENFTTHLHLYEQPPSLSVKALKRKMEKLHSKYVFAPADKAANSVIIICKRYYVEVLKEELNSTSTNVPAQLTKDKLLLRHIDTLTKSNIKID